MDSVKLYVILLATGCVLSMCMALDCNWKTQYEYKGKCCQICSLGEFPKEHCADSGQSVCTKCTGIGDHCFCDNNLCENDQCSKCSPRPQCKHGDGLKRTGLYKFQYICKSSLNQTVKDKVDQMQKAVLENADLLLLPRNRTQNATCDCQVFSGMVVCLVITGFVCLAMLMYICIQRTREQRTKKKYPLASGSLKAPSDECVCKLSKEEMGEV